MSSPRQASNGSGSWGAAPAGDHTQKDSSSPSTVHHHHLLLLQPPQPPHANPHPALTTFSLTPRMQPANIFTLPPELFLLITKELATEDLASLIVSSPRLTNTYVPLLTKYISRHGEALLTGSVIQRFHNLSYVLLRAGADPSPAHGGEGMTPLHHAALMNDLVSVNLLLRFGANPNANANGECTPLHLAAATGNHMLITLLVGAGANINARNDSGATPIYFAASRGREASTRTLLELGADYTLTDTEGWSPLHCAAVKGFAGVVAMLVDAGMPVASRDRANLMAQHYAAIRGHAATVRVLLQKGADVDAGDGMGGVELTAICGAANAGHVDVVRVLLEAGASVGLRDALFSAGSAGRAAVVELLVKSGRAGVMDRAGEVLSHAFWRAHTEVVVVLLAAGVQAVGSLAKEGVLLRLAVQFGYRKVVAFLLEQGDHVAFAMDMVLSGKCNSRRMEQLLGGYVLRKAPITGRLLLEHEGGMELMDEGEEF